MADAELWMNAKRTRYFLLPDAEDLPAGDLILHTADGRTRALALEALAPFELSEVQALRIARDQLGEHLGSLKAGLDEQLGDWRARLDAHTHTPFDESTTLTPASGPALLALIKNLPGVIACSLAADPRQVDAASATMQALQRQLHKAGISLDERFTSFPQRLAAMRAELRKPKG